MGVTILRPSTRILTYGLGDALRVVQPGGGAAAPSNGLLNNLVAYWPGNEANGNLLDLHTNALHLTDWNTVTSNPGLVYALARQYTSANLERHMRDGDDALLSTGDIDFTVASWAYMDSRPAYGMIATKWAGGVGGSEYALFYVGGGTDRYQWRIFDGTNAVATLNATTYGSPALTAWTLVLAYHDSVANRAGIQVNNGVIDTVGTTGSVGDSTARFAIGGYHGAATETFNGRIGPTMFWKSAAGAGGVLTAAQKTALYAAGAGLPYASFTV